jgi:hypothetical protein
MSKQQYVCPACRADLKGKRVCENCQCDLDEINRTDTFDPVSLGQMLLSMGAAFYAPTAEIMVPSKINQPSMYPVIKLQDSAVKDLLQALASANGLSLRRLHANHVAALLIAIRQGVVQLPEIDLVGDRPVLFLRGDELYWPDFKHDAARLIQSHRMYYRGQAITPERNGSFEQFLASCRCQTDADRDILRGYMLSTVLQHELPAAAYPMLVLAAPSVGSGKSTTAEVLAHIIGDPIVIHASQLRGEVESTRLLSSPNIRVVLIDNLSPAPGEMFISSDRLAFNVTSGSFTVRQMYATTGRATVPNRSLYMATANKAALSCELFSRALICTLSYRACNETEQAQEDGTVANWKQHWLGRREEVLADLLATALDNWKLGPVAVKVGPYRFGTWLMTAARLLRHAPPRFCQTSVIRPPLEVVLDHVFAQTDKVCLPVAEVQSAIADLRGHWQTLASQANWTRDDGLTDNLTETFVTKYWQHMEDGVCMIRRNCPVTSQSLS